MVIEKNKLVSIEYTLKDDDGKVLDTSVGSEPLEYLHGRGNIIPGLERHLEGKSEGDTVDCTVPPGDAYGEYDENLVFEVSKDEFESPDNIEVGMQFQSENGIVTVVGIDDDTVSVDTNHPLAGKNLHFNVKVSGVKDASPEEIEHGHPHSAGGCGGDCSCGEGDCGDGSEGGCGCGGCH